MIRVTTFLVFAMLTLTGTAFGQIRENEFYECGPNAHIPGIVMFQGGKVRVLTFPTASALDKAHRLHTTKLTREEFSSAVNGAPRGADIESVLELGYPVRATGQREIMGKCHIQSEASISRVDGNYKWRVHTHTWCDRRGVDGFTGGSFAIFEDQKGNELFLTDYVPRGVDGRYSPNASSANDERSGVLPAEIATKITNVRFVFEHDPRPRWYPEVLEAWKRGQKQVLEAVKKNAPAIAMAIIAAG